MESQYLQTYQNPNIARPRSAMDFGYGNMHHRDQNSEDRGLNLSYYSTAPESNPHQKFHEPLQSSHVNPYHNFYESSQSSYVNPNYHAAAPPASSYLSPQFYPGDLATPYESEEMTRAWKLKLPFNLPPVKVPTGKELVDKVTDTAKKALNVYVLAVISPYLAGLVAGYLERMEAQLNDGRAKHLPQWLRNAVYFHYPDVNLDKVRYGENMNLPTIDPDTAMTIGYSVYFPRSINLDHDQNMTTVDQAARFASDLHWILHELEHTSQFLKSGGNKYLWASKYVVTSTVNFNFSVNATHDSIQLERDADAKADSLLNYAVSYFSRGRPNIPRHGARGKWPKLDSEDEARNQNVATPADYLDTTAGVNLISQNSRYIFTVQGDGNLTVYTTDGRFLIWESKTSGKACPPFFLCRTENRDQVVLGGWHFAKDGTAIWTRIWETPVFTLSAGNGGGLYLIDPAMQYTSGSDVEMHLTDEGRLAARLVRNGYWVEDAYRRPVAIWESPSRDGITTQVLIPTTTTLPAIPRNNW